MNYWNYVPVVAHTTKFIFKFVPMGLCNDSPPGPPAFTGQAPCPLALERFCAALQKTRAFGRNIQPATLAASSGKKIKFCDQRFTKKSMPLPVSSSRRRGSSLLKIHPNTPFVVSVLRSKMYRIHEPHKLNKNR